MLFEKLMRQPGFWSFNGPYCDIVLSSRVRLARNMHALSFPNKMGISDINVIRGVIERFVNESKFSGNLIIINLNEIDSNEKRFLRERNIITYEMEISDNSLVVINDNDDFIIMINEEDHFRIQVIRPGLQLMETYRFADNVDDELNRFVSYIFSGNYGYLSACPSNLGTGLKVSAMLHLPILTLKKRIPAISQKVKKIGAEIIGTISEGNKTLGSIYQISNKKTLGISEVDIIELLDGVVNKILDLEDNSRDEYMSESRLELEDKIWRSFGLMTYSRRISYVEAMEHLSNIRLGVILAIIKKTELNMINDLMVNIQWSHLQKNFGNNFNNTVECDEYRAEYLRSRLSV